MVTLSLVSLNIEERKHLDRIDAFLKEHEPEVLCLQELCAQDVPHFESILNAKARFVPMVCSSAHNEEMGIGIFSRHSVTATSHWYGGTKEIRDQDKSSFESRYRTTRYELLVAEIEKEGEAFTVGTTHFPVTENGSVTDFQQEALEGLFGAIGQYQELVFCGDFNAPRGRTVFDAIAARYTDNIPSRYTSSIDSDLHRAGPLPLMVDGLFSTPEYMVSNVEMVCGLSDHCAIKAVIQKR